MPKLFYIRERFNPQFQKPYYSPMGQLTKKDAKKWEKPIYGFNNMLSYENEADYKKAIEKYKKGGFSVHDHSN